MNGFHVNAVGWILTLNVFALGHPEARELAGLWTDLVHTRREDIRSAHPFRRLLLPRSIPLSEKALGAFATLVDRMASLHPERFGCDALRRRRDQWALQAALGFLLWFLTATLLPKSWPFAAQIMLAFFLMGCGFVIPAVTLWRAASAVKHFSMNRDLKMESPRRKCLAVQDRGRHSDEGGASGEREMGNPALDGATEPPEVAPGCLLERHVVASSMVVANDTDTGAAWSRCRKPPNVPPPSDMRKNMPVSTKNTQ